MADLSDVQNAIVALASQILYPNGTGQPSAAGGVPVRIYAGWPDSASLDADLAVGTCHLSVFSRPEERNTTRYPKDWQQLSVNAATLTLTINSQTVTIGGTVPAANNPTNVTVMANGKPYVYAVQSSDTLTSIATALAALIAVGIAGTSSSGTVVTLPSLARINAARVGVTGTSMREIRRQERVFQLSVWSDTPAHRDAISQLVDVAMASISFLNLTDSSAARLIYKGSPVIDNLQKEKLYRRDLFYTIEYATTQVETETQITQEQLNISGTLDGVTSVTPVTTIYS